VVLAAVEAACTDAFNVHGVLATTMPATPVVVVNGPVAREVGWPAASTRSARATAPTPRSAGRCSWWCATSAAVAPARSTARPRASRASTRPASPSWRRARPFEPLAASRGVEGDALTLFAGCGWWPVVDQLSRTPESLARSFAASLRGVGHPKLAIAFDAMLIISPEHGRVLREAGWDRGRLLAELEELLTVPGEELSRGAGGMAEGLPPGFEGVPVPKFRPGGLLLVHAGGTAGLFSTVVPGWVSGAGGSEPTTVPIPRTTTRS
jgi:hypothetical protein